jgi:hypothetical protein
MAYRTTDGKWSEEPIFILRSKDTLNSEELPGALDQTVESMETLAAWAEYTFHP